MSVARSRDLSLSREVVAGLVLLALVVLTGWAGALPSAQAAASPTVVTLTFDDGDADQLAAAQTLRDNGLAGTFYVPSGWIGAPGYLSRADLGSIAAAGHEIGGHTVNHADLTQVPATEAKAQICNGRATLQSWGFQPRSFAYPFSTSNPTVEQLAAQCGYDTSRGLGDVRSPASCAACPRAETLPPANPNYLKAPDQVDSSWTLAQLKAQVTNATQNGGGWVVLTFHHVCTNIGAADCQADQSITPAVFNQFAAWLKTYRDAPANRTTVKTVDQTVRQYKAAAYPAYRTATAVAPKPVAAVGTNALTNPSLEATDAATGFPSCFQAAGWGTNTAAWAAVSPGRTGTKAQKLTVTGYSSGDAKLMPNLDLVTCAPSVTPGRTYTLSTWYQSTAVSQFALYYRDGSGTWFYWTSSPWLAATATPTTWTEATFTTPAVPAGATGVSFGLALIANGTLVTDDIAFVDRGTATAAPSALATTSSRTAAAPPTAQRQQSSEVAEVPGIGSRPGTQVAAEPATDGQG
ncbi:polysaccharide deacetylase family protein [Modestobacter muralis]|uniref:Polysaccharide deacetylase family protein n=1 Tax=Modestobacter muralis TaxID=1608614 RepID=A0A6P0HAS9_9ACTN|nr:polysaccharide deacetylase family protein [Modestobacter muralis]NEK95657.1 polysaccharide deacetylase family protein [Modestobacter muralis]NEN52545.1 polysaccharide deacetylase family protein [Modestobacter muralis]